MGPRAPGRASCVLRVFIWTHFQLEGWPCSSWGGKGRQPQMPEELEGLLMEFPAGGPMDSPLNMSSLWTRVKPGSAWWSQQARLGWVGGQKRMHLPGLCCGLGCIFTAQGANHRASQGTSDTITEGRESLKLHSCCSHLGCRLSQMLNVCLPVT